jgi:hypothetical protein
MLLDRLPERAALSHLLDGARAGRSGVLVMRGEPGVGKTALLDWAVESAAGLRVVRVAGVESEMELAFAALQQLCAPMLDKLGALPDPQRTALGVAFGLTTGAAPDRFLVGPAVLSLLSETAEQEPLLCVVDDAQWLDRASAQVLAFVARRLLAEPVALVSGESPGSGEDRSPARSQDCKKRSRRQTPTRNPDNRIREHRRVPRPPGDLYAAVSSARPYRPGPEGRHDVNLHARPDSGQTVRVRGDAACRPVRLRAAT